jgi:hypothetical protein
MRVTFYPRALLIAVVFLVMFGATLLLAIDVERGIATAGSLAVLAYVLIEVGWAFNPAAWFRSRSGKAD